MIIPNRMRGWFRSGGGTWTVGRIGGRVFSGKPDAAVVVFGLASDAEPTGLDLGIEEPHQLAKRRRVEGLDLLVGTDSDIACVHTIARNGDGGVWDALAVVHQPERGRWSAQQN